MLRAPRSLPLIALRLSRAGTGPRPLVPPRQWAAAGLRPCSGCAIAVIREGLQVAKSVIAQNVKDTKVYIKLQGADACHILPTGADLGDYLTDLKETFQMNYGIDITKCALSYMDNEGAIISISTAQDVQMCYKTAKNKTLTIFVKPRDDALMPSKTRPPPPPAPRSWGVLTDGMKKKMKEVSDEVSDHIRTTWKAFFNTLEPCQEKLSKKSQELTDLGYSSFMSNAVVYEELATNSETWTDLVDEMVASGLPESIGKTLKLAIQNKKGSKKSAYSSLWIDGTESMTRVSYYIKLQVIVKGEDEFDIVVALNQNQCKIPKEQMTPAVTGSVAELAFKQFIRLDSEMQWQAEVQQLI